MTEEIWDVMPDDFERLLIGRSIVDVDRGIMTLDNGQTLTIMPGGDCCAWFEGWFEAFDFEDNVITAVKQVQSERDEYGSRSWVVHVLSNHKKIAAISMEGNEGSGYYGVSFNLAVTTSE